jgi:hypothetical protein
MGRRIEDTGEPVARAVRNPPLPDGTGAGAASHSRGQAPRAGTGSRQQYATGSIRSTLAAAPQRVMVLAAKAAVFTLAAFLTGLAASFAAFFLGQAIFTGKGIPASLGAPGALRSVCGAALYLACSGCWPSGSAR